jgi:hypothetical protein
VRFRFAPHSHTSTLILVLGSTSLLMYHFVGSASGVVGEAVLVKGLAGNSTAGCASSGPQCSGHAPPVTLLAVQYELVVEPCTVCHTLACLTV